jgi:hypothetical protein
MITHDIIPDVNSGNDWIMVSITVASLIRIHQYPPVFEPDFISALAFFQWAMNLSRTVTTFFIYRRRRDCLGSLILSCLLAIMTSISAMFMSIAGGYSTDITRNHALVAISHFCAFENDIPVPTPFPTWEIKAEIPWWQSLIGLSVVLALMWGGNLLVIFDPFTRIKNFISARLSMGFKKQLRTLGGWAWKALILMLYVLLGAGWLIACLWLLYTMERYRNDLQLALGKQYRDSYWDFGQVTIIVLLLPTILQIFVKVISMSSLSLLC